MSLATNLLAIIRDEMKKHEKTRLISVRVCYGVLANVVPESLAFAFEVLIANSSLDGARLDLVAQPLRLACGTCKQEFTPEHTTSVAMFAPCPACQEEIGHTVVSGKGLYIDNIEVE